MLKENIIYKENLPINCTIMNLKEYPIHFHNDIEVVYVLRGNVKLKNGYYDYDMKEGDIYILNDREIHSYKNMGEDNAVLLMQLSLSYFSRYYETLKNSFFITDTNDAEDESIEELRELLSKIALENINSEEGYEKRIISLAHNLITCLMSDFHYFAMEDGKFVNESKNKGNKVMAGRLNRITEYMYENYNRRLTLTEIAEKEHLSIYYLSHFIKEAIGLSFQELLSFIRVEESEKLLLGSDKKIGEISVESGFSAVRYYIKYFVKWFGMHPADYRKKYKNQVRGRSTAAKFSLLPEKEVEELLCKQVEDIFSVTRRNRIEVISADFDTEEYIWKENSFGESYLSLLGKDFMIAVKEILKGLDIEEKDIVTWAPGYYIMRNFTEDRGFSRPFYTILFYNFNEILIEADAYQLSQSRRVDELRRYEKITEYYIKLSGLNGVFRIARCKYTREAIVAGFKKIAEGEGIEAKRNRLADSWLAGPSFSVTESAVSNVLGVQAQHQGSCAEIVMIDPVYI